MLPLDVNVMGLTLVTVPPVPVAVNVPLVNVKPDPILTSPGAAEDAFILPTILPGVIFCIFA